MGLFNLFPSEVERSINKKKEVVRAICNKEEEYKKIDDLAAQTALLKRRLADGETSDMILPDVFAAVREAARRTLDMRHFDVQLLGGIILHEGNIAEMRTGEGKTLVATLPASLHALNGKGVHIVTVNDYLARRDAVWMGQIYAALGLTVGVVNGQDQSFMYDKGHKDKDAERDEKGSFKIVYDFLRPCERKEAYDADITYGTNNEFVFDFLRDNTVYREEDIRQRDFSFVLVDEVDSILIDEARNPLIISAPVEAPPEGYGTFSHFVSRLKKEDDYSVDEKYKSVALTQEGIEKAEKMFQVDNLYSEGKEQLVHGILNALRAKELYQRDKEYVIRDGEAVIVDEFTGRLQPGRRWREGLHQAIEAKENLEVRLESKTVASITYQNYFKMYETLSGMTGTAITSSEEFYKVYGLRVIPIPTHLPSARKDNNDKIYQTKKSKLDAIAKKVKEIHSKGQPVLLGTSSIEENEELSQLFKKTGIPHKTLNAKNHESEGEIIAQAGIKGGVTIATNLAGRGVDIKLGGSPGTDESYNEVKELGGLFVIGTTRNEARRIDDQLRGRSGRQGDVGETEFFVSFEDKILRLFSGEWVTALIKKMNIPEDLPIENKTVTSGIEGAQRKIEGFNFDSRRWNLEFDSIINEQRDIVYRTRRSILEEEHEEHSGIYLNDSKESEKDELLKEFGDEKYRDGYRILVLRAIDMVWTKHLQNLEHARESASLRSYGQKEPLIEYKKESKRLFERFTEEVSEIVTDRHFAVADFLRGQPVEQT